MNSTATGREPRKERLAQLAAQYAESCDEIFRRFPQEAERVTQLEASLRRVLIVLGSPRGGTSVFKATLSNGGRFVSLPGEHRALFTLLGRNFPDHGGREEADDLTALSTADKDFLLRAIFMDAEQVPTTAPTGLQIERFGWAWALRLPVQWTSLDIDPVRVSEAARKAAHIWLADGEGDRVQLSLAVLRELQQCYPEIDPWRYDLPGGQIRRMFPHQPKPVGPPPGPIVEITPFVCPQLARTRMRGQARDETLILKASSDAYRLNSLRQLFAGWDMNILHLTRNPLAAVNGLLDGWAHHGFWQHDLCPSGMDAAHFGWCFDLVRNWEEAGARRLEEICLRQWFEPHERILELATGSDLRYLRMPFEQFQTGGANRAAMLERATRHGGRAMERLVGNLPEINVSRPFGPSRWKKRADRLLPLIDDKHVQLMCSEFGYPIGDPQSWI